MYIKRVRIFPGSYKESFMQCHEVDYNIFGDDLQYVEVELDPGETIVGEAGTMLYMDDGITFEAKMGDGSNPRQGMMDKLFSAGKRMLTGESLFMTHFTNSGSGKKKIAFAAPYTGKIIPLNMATMAGGTILCQKNSFLCAAFGTKLDIAFNKKLGAGLFGGEGFILQKISGDGMAFLHAGGSIFEKRLENQKILVDTGCVVAFEESINYDIQQAGNLKTMVFGGEGIFLAQLSGTGRIWIQSLPFSRLAKRIYAAAPQTPGGSKGEGSILGGLGNLFEQ
jgi:uncharacterized protein (TIGR00266 family)